MSTPPRRCDVAIVGAGITGLTAAFHLARAGLDVVVLEAGDEAGGVVQARRFDTAEGHWHFEMGPNTVLESHPEVPALLAAAGLEDERLEADPAGRKRYVWKDGALVPLPSGPGGVFTTPLLSLRGKLRLFAEPLIGRPAEGVPEQSVADFVARRLGREALESAVAPFVSGVYAGDPERLSLRWAVPRLHTLEAEHGGLVKGMAATLRAARKRAKREAKATGSAPAPEAGDAAAPATGGSQTAAGNTGAEAAPASARRPASPPPRRPGKAMISFRDGLDTVPRRLVEEIRRAGGRVLFSTPCRRVLREADGLSLETGHGDGPAEHLLARRAILTVPAATAADLLDEASAGESLPLAEIPYAPVAVVGLGVPLSALERPPDGFGFLVASRASEPAAGELRVLGCLFPSNLYPGRAPRGHAALSCFIGGRTDPAALELDDDALLAVCRRDLQRALGLPRDLPLPVTTLRRWHRGIPQYEVGHGRFARLRDGLEARLPGLHLAGNWLDGISVPDRIRHATHLARHLADRMGAA